MSDIKCEICGKQFKTLRGLSIHLTYCSGKRKSWNKGSIGVIKKGPLSEEHKKKVSLGMKKAQLEGRAWNIGRSRWNNKPSYPEEFFMEVIKNEFIDKNYIYEYPFSKYSLDFAWPHLKKCIEIDGKQHYESNINIKRDLDKNEFLYDNGWKVLRIRWKDLQNDTKKYIQIAKDFIEEDIENLEDNLEKYRKELEDIIKLKEQIKLNKHIDKCYNIAIKLNALIDAKIDFSKYGCIQKASEIIGISPQKTRNWIKRNYIELLGS